MRPYFEKRGQALLELALLGSILIMLLGILINYGLRYNAQQKIMQQGFRKAMASAAASMNQGTPTAVSHSMVKDIHIPNPSHPFAVGSVTSVSGGGSVTRGYQLDAVAKIDAELPRIEIDIPGQDQPIYLKTSGIRTESISESSLDRYKEIYGSANVKYGNGSITIIDPIAGEIVNYDLAVRQCRQIVDSAACQAECERGSGKDCSATCSQAMNVPWYCQGYYAHPDGQANRYVFPALDALFASSGVKAMGLQPDYTQTTLMDNTLKKEETASGITTTDNLDWQVETKRTITSKPYGDESGATNQQEVFSSVSQKKDQERKTDW